MPEILLYADPQRLLIKLRSYQRQLAYTMSWPTEKTTGIMLLIGTLLALLTSASALALDLKPCQLSTAEGLGNRTAHCGELRVPENPARPARRQLSLQIAVLESASNPPDADPVFFFAGRLGQSTVESFPVAVAALGRALEHRDIVLVDQRGTGKSNPLRCPAPEDWQDTLRTPSAQETAHYIERCLAQLSADTRYYTTTLAAVDIDRVRRALGYDKINLFGASYGSRIAQVYLRNYPGAVRSVILDGVVPTELALGAEDAANVEETLRDLFRRCRNDRDCNDAFPDVAQHYEILKARVTKDRPMLRVVSPRDGQVVEMAFTREALASTLSMLTYSAQSQAVLPLLISEAALERRYDRLASIALMKLDSHTRETYDGLETSVLCAEDGPRIAHLQPANDLLMGDAAQRVNRRCALWPHGRAADNFHQPFNSSVPMLILSGEYDPVTPPRYGERVLGWYSQARHLVMAGQGHGVSGRGCMPRLIDRFLASADALELDASCLDSAGPTPFFTTLLGSEP